jgi:hypothetical protein
VVAFCPLAQLPQFDMTNNFKKYIYVHEVDDRLKVQTRPLT